MLELKATKRDIKNKASVLRRSGQIPAVVYGAQMPSTALSVAESDFMHAWESAGESTVLALVIDGEKKDVLIHDVTLDAVSSKPEHVDFYVVDASKTVEVAVPLVFEGVAPAVKELGGNLVKVMHELSVEALPKDLPHEITVDISSLTTLESQIAVKDITLPNGVVAALEPDEVVATIEVAKEESEEESVAPDFDAIEVEKKGKKEEEAPADEASA